MIWIPATSLSLCSSDSRVIRVDSWRLRIWLQIISLFFLRCAVRDCSAASGMDSGVQSRGEEREKVGESNHRQTEFHVSPSSLFLAFSRTSHGTAQQRRAVQKRINQQWIQAQLARNRSLRTDYQPAQLPRLKRPSTARWERAEMRNDAR